MRRDSGLEKRGGEVRKAEPKKVYDNDEAYVWAFAFTDGLPSNTMTWREGGIGQSIMAFLPRFGHQDTYPVGQISAHDQIVLDDESGSTRAHNKSVKTGKCELSAWPTLAWLNVAHLLITLLAVIRCSTSRKALGSSIR